MTPTNTVGVRALALCGVDLLNRAYNLIDIDADPQLASQLAHTRTEMDRLVHSTLAAARKHDNEPPPTIVNAAPHLRVIKPGVKPPVAMEGMKPLQGQDLDEAAALAGSNRPEDGHG